MLTNSPRILQFFWLAVRVSLVWLAFHGLGSFVSKRFSIKGFGTAIPAFVSGMLLFALLTPLLSTAGLLTRTVLPIILALSALYGFLLIYRKTTAGFFKFEIPLWLAIPSAVLLLIHLLSDLFHAALPHGMVDPLITYAVQPDRWLDAGSMYFLSETQFSLFPLIGEMLAVWPASLAHSRVDQLVILQLFQMSLLVATFTTAVRINGLKKSALLAALLVGLSSEILVNWGAWAKVDMTALFFVTVALAELFRCYNSSERRISLFVWFLLGLSFSVKYTAVLAVIAVFPFLLLFGRREYYWKKNLFYGILLLISIPVVFAMRNILITGEPFYPFQFPVFHANESWMKETISSITAVKHHGSAGFFQNIISLFKSWSIAGILFLAGIFSSAIRRSNRYLIPILVVVIYSILCCFAFNPLSWGAKYAILLFPLMTVAGLFWLRNHLKVTLGALTVLLLLTSSVIGRLEFIADFVTDSTPLSFRPHDYPPAMPLQLWMNENLPEGSRLLSLWRPERYFSDHEVIVAQNHPDGIELFFDDDLEDELSILDRMEVDYVYFQSADPLPDNLEEKVALLEAVSEEGPLKPVIEVSGLLLCSYSR